MNIVRKGFTYPFHLNHLWPVLLLPALMLLTSYAIPLVTLIFEGKATAFMQPVVLTSHDAAVHPLVHTTTSVSGETIITIILTIAAFSAGFIGFCFSGCLLIGYFWTLMSQWQTQGFDAPPPLWRGNIRNYSLLGLQGILAGILLLIPLTILQALSLGFLSPFCLAPFFLADPAQGFKGIFLSLTPSVSHARKHYLRSLCCCFGLLFATVCGISILAVLCNLMPQYVFNVFIPLAIVTTTIMTLQALFFLSWSYGAETSGVANFLPLASLTASQSPSLKKTMPHFVKRPTEIALEVTPTETKISETVPVNQESTTEIPEPSSSVSAETPVLNVTSSQYTLHSEPFEEDSISSESEVSPTNVSQTEISSVISSEQSPEETRPKAIPTGPGKQSAMLLKRLSHALGPKDESNVVGTEQTILPEEASTIENPPTPTPAKSFGPLKTFAFEPLNDPWSQQRQ